MDEAGKSDNRVVAQKVSNKARRRAAEGLEGRRLAEWNSPQATTLRTQGREGVQTALGRVRQAAERQKGGARFTALLHHIYAIDALRAAFYELERDAAPGVDGETWEHYGQKLEAHLAEVSDRVRRGAYRPRPVRRAYVPKRDGQQRPIGVTALEDKIVQRATVAVLNTAVDAQKGSSDFAPALDGDVVASGDFVRSSKDGRAVLTFFDGSTLSVDPGSLVKVLTLNRLGRGGIQVLMEQTLGRSWAAVSKLKTPDSKFEIKTPSSIASVRGTAFETNVTQNADGTSHDWMDDVLAFEVVDSHVRAGVANLRAEIAWQRKSGASRERALP